MIDMVGTDYYLTDLASTNGASPLARVRVVSAEGRARGEEGKGAEVRGRVSLVLDSRLAQEPSWTEKSWMQGSP